MELNSDCQALLKEIQTRHKKVSVLTTLDQLVNINPTWSTGILELDKALGRGGIVGTKCYEFYGKESSGKSLIIYNIIAEVQKAGYLAVLYDAERSADDADVKKWMVAQGVQLNKLIYLRDTAEICMDAIHTACKNEKVGVIVIDSVAWMSTNAEHDRDMEDKEMAEIAKLLPKFLRKFTTLTKTAALVLINQARDTVGQAGPKGYAASISTPGGRALKHCANARIEVVGKRKYETVGGKLYDIGLDISFKVIKNKLAPPRKVGEFSFLWDTGIDHVDQVYRMARKYGLIKGNSWMKVTLSGEEVVAHGGPAMLELLNTRPDLYEALKVLIMAYKDTSLGVSEDNDAHTPPASG